MKLAGDRAMVKKIVVFSLLILFSFTSCKSYKPIKCLSDEGFMYAMIYDYNNTPVSGAAVYLNNKRIADSDIHGRFILEKLKAGDYSIKLIKKGYETLEEVFHYDPMQVLYFKLISASQLLALAENALDNKEFSNAELYLERAQLLEAHRSDILFLKSITYYLQSKNNEAKDILEKLIISGNTDPSVSQLLKIISQKAEKQVTDDENNTQP